MSLSYDTAKRLKEAGWKQDYSKGLLNGGFVWEDDDTDGDIAYAPTLSEIIDACGERFHQLRQIDKEWFAWSSYPETSEGKGSTHEEAVAELWLALNKKHETK